MPDFHYITEQSDFDRVAEQIFRTTYLAIDTESSGFHTYYPELCLIQISSETGHYIIDPLTVQDLAPLAGALQNEDIVKIFHSAASDIEEFLREFGWQCRNVFDTLIACRMLSQEGCSLGAVVERYLGVHLEKREQKSNWKKRPLTQSQLNYAHLDTRFLPDIMFRMTEQLQKKDLFEEFLSETEFIASTVSISVKKDTESAWKKVNGVKNLTPVEKGRFREIHRIREHRAEQENLAPFRVLSNDSMFQIAESAPDTLEELKYYGMHPSMFSKDGEAILEALRSAEPVTSQQMRSHTERDPEKEELQAKLKAWRNELAEKRQIDSSLIISNRSIKEVVEANPATLEQLNGLNVMSRWKADNYGRQILSILKESGSAD